MNRWRVLRSLWGEELVTKALEMAYRHSPQPSVELVLAAGIKIVFEQNKQAPTPPPSESASLYPTVLT